MVSFFSYLDSYEKSGRMLLTVLIAEVFCREIIYNLASKLIKEDPRPPKSALRSCKKNRHCAYCIFRYNLTVFDVKELRTTTTKRCAGPSVAFLLFICQKCQILFCVYSYNYREYSLL